MCINYLFAYINIISGEVVLLEAECASAQMYFDNPSKIMTRLGDEEFITSVPLCFPEDMDRIRRTQIPEYDTLYSPEGIGMDPNQIVRIIEYLNQRMQPKPRHDFVVVGVLFSRYDNSESSSPID